MITSDLLFLDLDAEITTFLWKGVLEKIFPEYTEYVHIVTMEV